MRFKANLRRNKPGDPEPHPDILQNALFSDDFRESEAEIQALDQFSKWLGSVIESFEATLKEFEMKGGKLEYKKENDRGSITLTLGDQSVYLNGRGDVKTVFKVGGNKNDRDLMKKVMRAEICLDEAKKRMVDIKGAMDFVINVHTIRGMQKVIDETMKHATNLDEISRGALIAEELDKINVDD